MWRINRGGGSGSARLIPNHATQGGSSITLTKAQLNHLPTLTSRLPESAHRVPLRRLLTVSFKVGATVRTLAYDRADLPEEALELCLHVGFTDPSVVADVQPEAE